MRKNIATKDRIIVALDVNNKERVEEIVETLGDSINFYKVGKELFVSEGPDIIRLLKDKGKSIFLDLKFHDIPNTVSKAAASLMKLGVDMFTIHASGGRMMMEGAVKTVEYEWARQKEKGVDLKRPKVLAVTLLTSLTQKDLIELDINSPEHNIAAQVKRLAVLAADSAVDAIVASPLEIEMLRENLPEDMLIVTPGIRPSGSVTDDQKRIMTPGEAIKKGADYLVIGRPILNAPDPKEAAEKIISELE